MDLRRKSDRILLFLIAILIACLPLYVILLFPPEKVFDNYYRPITETEVFAMGTQDTENQEFLADIKKDLHIENVKVKILYGPYFYIIGDGALFTEDHPLRYYMLIDKSFYMLLNKPERKALIAHEMGHVLNKPTSRTDDETMIARQIEADTYAASKVGPDAVINLMNILFVTDTSRKSPEYIERMGSLEKLKKNKQGH